VAFDVPLFRTGPLSARVVSAAGEPVAGATVTCLRPETAPVTTPFFRRLEAAVTDASGVARFDGLAPGEYHLQASTPDARSPPLAVTAPQDGLQPVTLALAEETPPVALTVTVHDRFGATVEGAPVRVCSQPSGGSTMPGAAGSAERVVPTGPDGAARFELLPPGLYLVSCTDLDRGVSSTHLVVLSALDVPDVDLVLH